MQGYYVNLENGEWQKVKGHKITIEGFEDLDLFYHKEGKYYHISEGRTGIKIVPECANVTCAKELAKIILECAKKRNMLLLNKVISKSIKQYGLSPRYKREKV
jgi:hypothetical protein